MPQAGSSDKEVLGALLHDIGHMIGMDSIASRDISQYKQMDGFGIMDHEEIGAEYLKRSEFSRRVVEICCSHVSAKQYLCHKNPGYFRS